MSSKAEIYKFWEEYCPEVLNHVEEIQKGTFTPFIGAGMSFSYGYPGWAAFLQDILKNVIANDKSQAIADTEKLLADNKYLQAAERLDASDLLNHGLASQVKRRFGRPISVKNDRNYVQLLLNHGVNGFITTNYDPVIESSIRAWYKEHKKTDSLQILIPNRQIDEMDTKTILREGKDYVLKLHGDAGKLNSIILTEAQYEQYYGDEKYTLPKLIEYIWEHNNIVFMGCGLSRDYLFNKIHDIAGKTNDNWKYAILEAPKNHEDLLDSNTNPELKKTIFELNSYKIYPIWFKHGDFNSIYDILQILCEKNTQQVDSTKEPEQLKEDDLLYDYSSFIDSKALLAFQKGSQKSEELFNVIMMQQEKKISFEELFNNIVGTDQFCPLLVRGQPGTGKSTLFSLIYGYIKERRTDYYLGYIDLYKFDHCDAGELKLRLEQALSPIQIAADRGNKAILFLDGINEFNRGENDSTYQKILLEKLKAWEANDNIQVCITIGLKNTDDDTISSLYVDNTEVSKFIYEDAYKLSLHRINRETKRFREFAYGMLNYYGLFSDIPEELIQEYRISHPQKDANGVLKLQKRKSAFEHYKCMYGDSFISLCNLITAKEIEFRTINLFAHYLYEHRDELVYSNNRIADISATSIFADHYKQHLGESFHDAGKQILNKIMMVTQGRQIDKYDYLFYKGSSVKDYFIASYFVHLLSTENKDDLLKMDCIFTPGINRMILDIISDQKLSSKSIMQFILKHYLDAGIRLKDELIYLLGRLDVGLSRLKNKCVKSLKLQYNEIYDSLIKHPDDVADSQIMLFRTLAITLISMGESDHENDFYLLLINNRRIDDINRNFFIMYFTMGSFRVDQSLNLRTDICTPEHLKRSYMYLQSTLKRNSKWKNLNLITLVSIIQYSKKNNIIGIPSDKKKIVELLTSYLKDRSIGEVVNTYVHSIVDILENNNRIIEEVYKIKDVIRQSWHEAGRDIHSMQSVADHSWGCQVIAEIFLHDDWKQCKMLDSKDIEDEELRKSYNKNEIIRILLAHEIGKTYTGNTLFQVENQEAALHQKRLIAQFNLAHEYIDEFNLAEICNRWQIFNTVKTDQINYRIAKEIDILEPLFQLYLERDKVSDGNYKTLRDDELSNVTAGFEQMQVTSFGKNLFGWIKTEIFSE